MFGLTTQSTSCTAARRVASVLVVLAVCSLAASAARATDRVSRFSVFAEEQVIANNFINALVTERAGPIGSNGNVWAANGRYSELRGVGSLVNTGNEHDVSGDVVFGGNVELGVFSKIGGDVHAGGDAMLSGKIDGGVVAGGNVDVDMFFDGPIGGDLTAGGNVVVHGGTIQGSLRSNGGVTLESGSTIGGDVSYRDYFTEGSSVTIGGTVSPTGAAAVPRPFGPLALPEPSTFTAGTEEIRMEFTDDRTLPPGTYGALVFVSSSKLRLSAGDYVFSRIDSIGSFPEFRLDLSGGPINIFVEGDITLKSPTFYANDLDYMTATDTARDLAGLVFVELHGDLLSNGNLFGTYYAPEGSIHLDGANLTGSALSGHTVTVDGANLYFAESQRLVPEPASLVLLAIGGVGLAALALRARRRHVP